MDGGIQLKHSIEDTCGTDIKVKDLARAWLHAVRDYAGVACDSSGRTAAGKESFLCILGWIFFILLCRSVTCTYCSKMSDKSHRLQHGFSKQVQPKKVFLDPSSCCRGGDGKWPFRRCVLRTLGHVRQPGMHRQVCVRECFFLFNLCHYLFYISGYDRYYIRPFIRTTGARLLRCSVSSLIHQFRPPLCKQKDMVVNLRLPW